MANTKTKAENLRFKDSFDPDSAILGTLEGPCADFMASTRNNRFYSEALWEKTFSDPIVKELIENGGIPGELDHPEDREETDSSRIAVLMREAPKKKNGKLWAKFDILNTPLGKIAYTLAKAGFKLGISSRGTGDVYEDENGNEVVDESSYDFKAFDLVLLPAVKSARLNLVTESFKTRISLKESFDKIMRESTDDERELISETIENLGLLKETKSSDPVKKGTTLTVAYSDKNGDERVVYFECDKNYSSKDCEQLRTAIQSSYGDIGEIENITESMKESISTHMYSISYYDKNGNTVAKDYSVNKNEMLGAFYELLENYRTETPSITRAISIENELGEAIKSAELIDEDWEINESKYPSLKKDVYNKLNESEDLEADDDGSELVAELQETLKANKELNQKIRRLQEELSVCYAKEVDEKEKSERQKDTIKSLYAAKNELKSVNEELSVTKQRVLKAQKQIREKDEQISLMNEKLSTKDKQIFNLLEKYKIQGANSNSLKEELDTQHDKYVELHNKAQRVIEKWKSKCNTLDEEKQSLLESLEKDKQTHSKDIMLKESQFQKELKKQQELTEKYRESTRIAVGRYIQLQSDKLGCTPQEIKSKLNENYTFKDIDNVCKNLQQYQINISKLPVDINKSKVTIKESVDTKQFVSDDNIIDREHLIMAGLL